MLYRSAASSCHRTSRQAGLPQAQTILSMSERKLLEWCLGRGQSPWDGGVLSMEATTNGELGGGWTGRWDATEWRGADDGWWRRLRSRSSKDPITSSNRRKMVSQNKSSF